MRRLDHRGRLDRDRRRCSCSTRYELPLYQFRRRNLNLKGSSGGHCGIGDFKVAPRWFGQLDLVPIISHRFELVNIAEAFDIARNA